MLGQVVGLMAGFFVMGAVNNRLNRVVSFSLLPKILIDPENWLVQVVPVARKAVYPSA
jgi:hypothetical protein